MKSYITYKNQIEGFKDVLETVKATEKIAASYIHFLRKKVSSINTYLLEIEKILSRLSSFYKKKSNPLLQKRKRGKKALVILTGDKGLVRGLWHKVINTFLEKIKMYQSIIVIGAKGEKYLKEENVQIVKSFTAEKGEINSITNYIFSEFRKEEFSQVNILYPSFVSLAQQTPNFVLFLPFEFEKDEEKKAGEGFPIFEPSKEKVFDNLLEKYIGSFFYKIFLETKLSELSARTVAMEHAKAKTEELIGKLMLDYTKQRRRIITQRQLESFAAHKII